MNTTNNYEVYSFDDILDKEFGCIGTPERDAFESRVNAKVDSLEKASYHITLPIALHKLIVEKATELGTSASAYITKVMSREFARAQV